jgi:coenzyme F420-reducing hydrogenase delta subunit
MEENKTAPKILVFSTEKISDPAIDLAGLLKKHYPPTVYTINVPCSSAIKSRWILHAFEKGFDGVFIAADGTDCSYSETCTERTRKRDRPCQIKNGSNMFCLFRAFC